MSFAENLLYLRKKAKITQEELADELDVSRQSVSKWETGEAYPETDKLIALCDKFGVSMDELVRGNLCTGTENNKENIEEEEQEQAPALADISAYKKQMSAFARNISLGVFLILLGVSLCVAIGGISTLYEGKMRDMVSTFGGIAVLLFVTPAVFLFVFSGISMENFKKKEQPIKAVFSDEEKERFEKKFVTVMACLVSGILLAVAALIGGFVFLDNVDPSRTDKIDMIGCFIAAAFLFILSFIIGGLCYMGIRRDYYGGKPTGGSATAERKEKISDGICGAVMLSATAVFLLLGFVWNLWHPGWVVFPIGGIICAVISTLLRIGKD